MNNDNGTEKKAVFVTSGGVEISLRPVSQILIDKVRASVTLPQAPKYQTRIELPGQEPVVEYYTMRDESDARTPEERRAWDEYTLAVSKVQQESSSRIMKAILLPGAARDIQLPQDNEWLEVQKIIGVELPDNEIELKLHYLQTELLISAQDLIELIASIMELSGVPEEAVNMARNSFRRSVR